MRDAQILSRQRELHWQSPKFQMWLISIGKGMGESIQSRAGEGPIGQTNIQEMVQMVRDTFLSGHMILAIDQETESLSI